MNTNALEAQTQPTTPQSQTPVGPPDPRPALVAGLRIVTDLAHGVRPDQLDQPTPCDDYTVRELLSHLLGAVGRTGLIAQRVPLEGGLPLAEIDVTTVADEIEEEARAAEAGWSDDSLLSAMVTVPFGTLPGAAAGFGYANEMLVHAWDLATATGQPVQWPADEQLDLVRSMFARALPATGRDETIPFAAAVSVGEDAAAIDRLVAYSGRNPHAA